MALVVFRDVFIGTLLLICGFFSEAFSDNENSVFEMLSTELYALLHDEKLDEWFTPVEKALLSFSDELGYLFLPTGEDLKNRDYGFGSNKARQGYGTPYALANGLFKYSNGSSPYWTRSQSATKAYGTRCTKVDGRLGYIRCVVMNEGVRPAVRLSLAGLEVTGGSGTAADPYRLLR